MARKNNVKSENPGTVHFDSRTRAVMAGQDSHDNVKEKVQSVREVVPGKSNNEIVMVLQYYDYNVEKAIQAYLEDGAKEALKEWHMPVAKPNKKKKNKKKPVSASQAENGTFTATGPALAASAASPSPTSSVEAIKANSSQVLSAKQEPTKYDVTKTTAASKYTLSNGDLPKEARTKSRQEESSVGTEGAGRTEAHGTHGHGHGHSHHSGSHGHSQRTHTTSERSTSSVGAGGDNHTRRPFQGLERAIKDLQRQTTSLERLHLVLDHEIDRSYKSIKNVFEEMRAHMNTREKQLISEMDIVKQQAYDVFKMRQEKAAALKIQIERAEKISEAELVELRADVKHFVSDRKIDEELGRTTRFHYDSDHLREEIMNFGEVKPVKCIYSLRRPSVSSVASSGHGNDESLALPQSLATADPQDSAVQGGNGKLMTAEEMAELQVRLKNSLKIQGFSDRQRPVSINGVSTQDVNSDRGTSGRQRPQASQQIDQRNKGSGRSHASSTGHGATGSGSFHQEGSPSPQRSQHSPSGRGSAGRMRGGRGGSGSYNYRGGSGQGWGSPRRPYSGPGGGGGTRGGGDNDHRQRGRGAFRPGGLPVAINGGAS
ncbi:spermatogenesis-associated serine-rich protein 2-like isoform X2 [Pomacea canaliculata]|uniref:spermatogenesis-associated serine-rich protein 2-like isoform X2 n=1 Tax=Pomacea canaliculata TaxID=400727 RepID=UPI000D735CD2|nr:spermatogenesis-associated serine-rich protein 2-like isoform X2 [Pomacea canaliculata]